MSSPSGLQHGRRYCLNKLPALQVAFRLFLYSFSDTCSDSPAVTKTGHWDVGTLSLDQSIFKYGAWTDSVSTRGTFSLVLGRQPAIKLQDISPVVVAFIFFSHPHCDEIASHEGGRRKENPNAKWPLKRRKEQSEKCLHLALSCVGNHYLILERCHFKALKCFL